MSAAKYTPGPWAVQGRNDMEVSGPSGSYVICDVGEASTPHDAESYATAQADARLIAAAPDLLAALEKMRLALAVLLENENVQNTATVPLLAADEAIRVGDAAIAKARGGA